MAERETPAHVYVVEQGWDYDGSEVIAICATRGVATREAAKLMKTGRWTKQPPCKGFTACWRTSSGFVSITRHGVMTSQKGRTRA